MAEALLSGVLQQLATIVVNDALQEVRLLKGVKEEVRNLKTNMEAVRALLDDADEKQLADKSIKLWLDELKDAAYDMEDILDDWNFALLKKQTDGVKVPSTLKTKVRRFLSCFSFGRLASYHKIAKEIKEINERLDGIAKRKNNFDLAKRETKKAGWRETTYLVDVSKIHGRDEVKDTIKKCLLNQALGESPIMTISLEGMGGIGKTSLAQMIFDEIKEGVHFDKKMWVCVSDFFDEKKVARDILMGLEGLDQTSAYLQDSITLSILMERICRSIDGKKFFLVLDDVWTDQAKDWESLKLAFKKGALGSRILLTTRKNNVSKMMESSFTFPLEVLSDEVCWSILAQAAFSGRGDEERKKLESIGREIAKRCKGLPLAAKALGGLLQYKTSEQEWKSIASSEIWKLNMVQKDVFAPLLLSFYDLPSTIRRCFEYCVMYPKDTNMYKQHLIYQWMAQGFLGSDNNEDMESTGEDYFNYLVARSFFQDIKIDEINGMCSCKMHDIVHDFAQFLTEQEYVRKKVEFGNRSPIELSSDRNRHLAVLMRDRDLFPVSISGTRKLRSIMILGGHSISFSGEVWTTLLDEATSLGLRYLEFSEVGSGLSERIPAEIGKLIHLRYLKLFRARNVLELPKEMCELLNLQYLNLRNCVSLKKLPNGIGKLINLRVLLTHASVYYPKEVAKLTRLRVLSVASVRVDRDDPEQLSLGDLENLDKLQVLDMVAQGNNIDETQARRAKLDNKMHFKHVAVVSSDGIISSDDLRRHLNISIPFNRGPYFAL